MLDPASGVAAEFPLLSVRGEADRFVPPDSVDLGSMVEIVRDTKDDALRAANIAVETVRDSLRQHGGVVNEVASLRAPLRWVTRRVSVAPYFDERKGQTGRYVGRADITISIRDLGLLEPVEQLPEKIASFRIMHVQWFVDSDNPQWSEVRLEAIAAAMSKGRDYAAALGSRLVSVEHVADLGLLAGAAGPQLRGMALAAGASGESGGSLDPVPQNIGAAVEARFRMAPVPLP